MNRTRIFTTVCLAGALALGACSSSQDGAAAPQTPASSPLGQSLGESVATASEGVQAAGETVAEAPASQNSPLAFGETWTTPDGIAVTVSKPKPFTPSDTAAGMKFKDTVLFDITVKNGSKKNWDPAAFHATMNSGDEAAEAVFDTAKGVEGAPSASLRPGKEIKFKSAFSVKDPKDMYLEANVDFSLLDQAASWETR